MCDWGGEEFWWRIIMNTKKIGEYVFEGALIAGALYLIGVAGAGTCSVRYNETEIRLDEKGLNKIEHPSDLENKADKLESNTKE